MFAVKRYVLREHNGDAEGSTGGGGGEEIMARICEMDTLSAS